MKHLMFLSGLLMQEANGYDTGGSGDVGLGDDPLGLNLDLTGVDTARPVMMEGLYLFNVDKIEVVENKDKTGHNLLVHLKTASSATSLAANSEGNTDDIQPGFPQRVYMPLQPNPEKPDFDFRKQLARFQDAITGSTKENRGPFLPMSYIGQQVVCKITVQDDPQYGKGNSVASFSRVTG